MNLSYLKHPNSLYLDTTLIKLQDFSCIVKFSELFYLIFLFLFHFAEAQFIIIILTVTLIPIFWLGKYLTII